MNKTIVAISALILGSVSVSAFAYGSMYHNHNQHRGPMHTSMMQNQGMCMGMNASHRQAMMQHHQAMHNQSMTPHHQNMRHQTMMQYHQNMHAPGMMANSTMQQ